MKLKPTATLNEAVRAVSAHLFQFYEERSGVDFGVECSNFSDFISVRNLMLFPIRLKKVC